MDQLQLNASPLLAGLIGSAEHHDNLSFVLVNCLLKFAAKLGGASVVSVFSGMLMLSLAQRERLMEFGVTFVRSDYSRGYEPVHMNGFRFYNDIYLIHVEDVAEFGGLVKQLHAAQQILNPDRQAFVFLLSARASRATNETDDRAALRAFFPLVSEYIFEFVAITSDRSLPHATHHLPAHQRLIHMLRENYVGYYYWNSCLEYPRKITAAAVNFRTKEQLREYFSNGRLCPPKVDKIRVRLSVWAPFVDEDSPPGSLNFTSGLDILLISAIARQLRVGIEYSNVDGWSDDFANTTTPNNWKALMLQEVDLVLASTIATHERYKYFHATESYFHDSDGFCVPVALRVPQYKKWSMAVNIYVALFAVYLIFVPVVYYFDKKYNPASTLSVVYIYCIASLCSLSIPRMPRGERARWLYMCWSLYCFLLNIYYQSKLISIMYKPSYEKQVATPEDLVKTNLRLLFLPHYMRYFEGPFDPKRDYVQYKIKRMIEPCLDIDICLKNLTQDRTSAMCLQRTFIDYRMSDYLDPEGKPLMYCFKDPINLSAIRFHVSRNFPLAEVLDRKIMNVKESGLISKWSDGIYSEAMKGMKKGQPSETEHKPLRLGTLRILFYLYLAGIGISVLGYIAEVVYYRRVLENGGGILQRFRPIIVRQ